MKSQNVKNVAIVRNSFNIFGGKFHASQDIHIIDIEYRYICNKNN